MNAWTWLDDLTGAYPFSTHMTEHMLLAQVIAPLILLAVPYAVARAWSQIPMGALLVKLLRKHSFTWLIGMGVMWAWHIPTMFQVVASHAGMETAQSICFLLSGTVFWWPIFSPLPRERMNPVPWAVLYLASGCLACTVLGILLSFSPVDSVHASSAMWPASAITVADQHAGGLIMWVPGCLVYLCAVMAMFVRWYNAPEETPVAISAVVSKSELPL